MCLAEAEKFEVAKDSGYAISGGEVSDADEYKIVLVDWDTGFEELVGEGSD